MSDVVELVKTKIREKQQNDGIDKLTNDIVYTFSPNTEPYTPEYIATVFSEKYSSANTEKTSGWNIDFIYQTVWNTDELGCAQRTQEIIRRKVSEKLTELWRQYNIARVECTSFFMIVFYL